MYHQCDFYFYNLTSVFCVDMLLNESIRTFFLQNDTNKTFKRQRASEG